MDQVFEGFLPMKVGISFSWKKRSRSCGRFGRRAVRYERMFTDAKLPPFDPSSEQCAIKRTVPKKGVDFLIQGTLVFTAMGARHAVRGFNSFDTDERRKKYCWRGVVLSARSPMRRRP